MIRDTPTAEIVTPMMKAIVPRIRRGLVGLAPVIEKARMARIGGIVDARNFFEDETVEIAAIVRNLVGREKASTVKNAATQSVEIETKVPIRAARGNARRSRNQERISIPISLRKLRTLSQRRIAAEFSVSPRRVGITMTNSGKSNETRRSMPARGRARMDERTVIVVKTEMTSGVPGKLTLRTKLKAPTVPPTPPLDSSVTEHPLGASYGCHNALDRVRTLAF